eukprot:scaffold1013_cov74-Phaeocystis_antarctica.AAC.2
MKTPGGEGGGAGGGGNSGGTPAAPPTRRPYPARCSARASTPRRPTWSSQDCSQSAQCCRTARSDRRWEGCQSSGSGAPAYRIGAP